MTIYQQIIGHDFWEDVIAFWHHLPGVSRMDRLRANGFPDRYLELCFCGSIVDSESLTMLESGIAAGKRTVVLCGKPGTGKTTACVVVASRTGIGKYVTAYAYAAIAPWDDARQQYLRTRFLVIDDLGLERDADRLKIEELIFERHARQSITAISTNLTIDEVCARYSDRIVSRLREDGSISLIKQVLRAGN